MVKNFLLIVTVSTFTSILIASLFLDISIKELFNVLWLQIITK